MPQRSGGPGILGTALIAGGAGLGGAALYNAFNRPDHNQDPKTTVIIVNNTAPAAAPAESTVTQPTLTSQYPQQPYPQQYPGYYPQQPYPYDPNNPYQQPPPQYYPGQQPPPQYYPGQQPYPQQPYPQQPLPVAQPVGAPVDGVQTPAVGDTSTIAVPVAVVQDGTTAAATIAGETTLAGDVTVTTVPSVEISTSAGLTNTSVPINAKSSIDGETVEQKSVTVQNQENPKASQSTAENSGISMEKSISVLTLSMLYHILAKYLL